jgi:integrase
MFSAVANLEFIKYTPFREVIEDRNVRWVHDKLARPIDNLPQIFWDSGESWHEASHWALTKATSPAGGDIKTVTTLMKHLAAYASWLESVTLDWRHFPMRKQDRAIFLYRGKLIAQRDTGSLAPSTARARIAAVIQFYRHAQIHGLVERKSPIWKDRQVVVRYYDTVGFQRTLVRASSELAIPNRSRPGLRLHELHLILSLGVLTGARIETITTLGVKDVENARPEAETPDTYRIRVGPGTGVNTKFDVSGELMVPKFLINDLKEYAYSMRRLRRQGRASESNRGFLFLTIQGNPYESGSFNRLMTDLRRRALAAGIRFMASFKFHQTRATFGTWLMEVALRVAGTKAAVAFVKDAMLHKDEKTTFLYVRFHEQTPVKAAVANEFSAVFSGVVNRDWSQYDA